MTLQIDPKNPALWVDPQWSGAGPSTFAIVIGVSKYEYLHKDKEKDTYGLGQLYVSALTAYRFFAWLRNSYRHPDKPLARCWLLLSPTPAEVAAEPSLAQAPVPSFDACEQAIGQWFQSMQDLNSVYAEKSRAIFFFSGHGLEVTPDKQVLLPADYLRPPLKNVNRALSTYNLHAGLLPLPLLEHFFFVDACRNDHQALREASVEGTAILNVWPSYRARPDVKAPIVYATGPGAAAWQPTDPKNGPSVFGRALVEGLECTQGMEPACDDTRCWVTFRGLEDFLDPRVTDLLLAVGARVKQPVRIWGPVGKTEICEAPRRPVPRAGVPPAAPPPPTPMPSAAAPTAGPAAAVAARFAPLEVVHLAGWHGPTAAGGFEETWKLVQNEFLTKLLTNAHVYDFRGGKPRPLASDTAARALTVRKIARDSERRMYRIDVQLERRGPLWVEFHDEFKNETAACVLPDDQEIYPRYTLEIDFDDQGGTITDFDVVLATDNPGLLGAAATLWGKFRTVDIGKSVTPDEAQLLEQALAEKMVSPLAATVASLLLMRAWRYDLLHDWPKNLVTWFPDRPDGCVILAEELLRTSDRESPANVVPWLLELEKRGLPHTAEGLAHAARQVGELLQFAFLPELKRSAEQQARYAALQRLDGRLRRALRVFRPGGLCTTFMGRKELVVPELIVA